jgi:hypothetical protein
VSGSAFVSNTALIGGGFSTFGAAAVSASSISGSSAQSGGGLFAVWVTVVNSTISSNQAIAVRGGAAISATTAITLVSSTLVNNSGPAGAAASVSARTGPLIVQDSIIAGTGSPSCAAGGGITRVGKNVIPGPDTSCTTGAGPAPIPADPTLAPLADNGGGSLTHALLAGSPAIDQSSTCPPTDQRGLTRIAPCDIGAYESGIAPSITSIVPQVATALDPGFTLSVNGSGFITGTVVLWNGSPRQTMVVSATLLAATIAAGDLIAAITVPVQARYGAGIDSTSNALNFGIAKKAQTIAFGTLPDRPIGESFALTATATSGLSVSFTSDTPSVCTVSGTTVMLHVVGTCTVRATQAGNATYGAASDVTQSFAVTTLTQTITFAPLSGRPIGETFELTATATSGLAVSFGSETPSVCTVTGTTVTLTAVGNCTIRASQSGDATYAAAPDVIQSFAVGFRLIFLGSVQNGYILLP